MRPLEELLIFLENTMSMTGIYQPVIIRYLLEQEGQASKKELARVLSAHDDSVQEYYQRIVMRWPKITLTKHNIITYDRKDQVFSLTFDLSDEQLKEKARLTCETKITAWIEKKLKHEASSKLASKRYRVLKAARGRCELCGISAKLVPIDIDHIVPRSKANKQNMVFKDGKWVHIDDEQNLQALCFRCNRAKRDTDDTDFRLPRAKLVRDLTPAIRDSEGHNVSWDELQGKKLEKVLYDKLLEGHIELLESKRVGSVVELIETALAIAGTLGYSRDETVRILEEQRALKGGFEKGLYLKTNALE